MKYCAAGDKYVSASGNCIRCSTGSYPAVHFELAAGIAFIDDLPDRRDDVQLLFYKFLSTEPGVNCHNKDKIDIIYEWQNCVRTRSRTQSDAGLLSAGSDDGERFEGVLLAVGFDMAIYEIRTGFADGQTIGDLMDRYALSYDSIKRIVYNRKEIAMLKYSATLSSARAYAEAGKLDAWIHLYLNEDGRNIPFSDGLKLFDRYYFSPALFPIHMFKRCAGPEPEMKYRIDPDWWAQRVAELEKSIRRDEDMPPFMVHFADGEFELNDGNHRHQAYENLGIENAWAIVWITEKEELDDFVARYGEYVKDCKVIRR